MKAKIIKLLKACAVCSLSLAAMLQTASAAVAPEKFGLWPKQLGAAGNLYSLARHPNGTILGAGSFRDSFSFGGRALTRLQGSGDEGWVGTFTWNGSPNRAFTFRSNAAGEVRATGIAVDQVSGNTYVVGFWQDHLQVEDDSGSIFQRSPTAGNVAQMFLAKFLNGEVLEWVTIIGGGAEAGTPIQMSPSRASGTKGISVDLEGNIYVVGYCRNGTTFESVPSSGSSNLIRNNVAGTHSGFLAKYKPNGGIDWVRFQDSADAGDVTTSVVTDADGSIYLAGYSGGTLLTLESDTTQTARTITFGASAERLYIAKYSSQGRPLLQWRFGGDAGSASSQQKVSNMAIDANKLVVCGWHTGNLRKPDGSIWSGGGNQGAKAGYVAAFDKAGAPLWAKTLAVDSSGENEVNDVAIDETGDVLVSGYAAVPTGSSQGYGGLDGFLGHLSGGAGSIVWMQNLGENANDAGFGVIAAPGRHVISAGSYTSGIRWKGTLLYDISPDNVGYGCLMGFCEGATNDDFANRTILTGTTIKVETSNLIATTEIGEPLHAFHNGGHSLWWEWTAPQSGVLIVDTIGSLRPWDGSFGNQDLDTTLAIYSGTSLSDLTVVGSNDDYNGNYTSRVLINVVAGNSYKIAVDGYNGLIGVIKLNLSFTAATPVPEISSSRTATATTGQSFSYQIQANNGPFGFGASGLPSGLSVNTITGLISGTPIASGTFNIGLTATNASGFGNATLVLTVNPASSSRVIRIVPVSVTSGGTVIVPIDLVSQGDENALGFSLVFDQSKLSNPQVSLGTNATGASLNVNSTQASSGKLGIALAKNAGSIFSSGTQRILNVTFSVASVATATETTISFGDQPIFREVVNSAAGVLSANFQSGVVTVTVGYEGDVSPRPTGNNAVGISDWVQIGRFVAGLDAVDNGVEFQRADVAPLATSGDGRLTIADWVQAGRYAAGLDAITSAGGPTSPVGIGLSAVTPVAADSSRLLSIESNVGLSGSLVEVGVSFMAQGDENAIGFSVSFDPSKLSFSDAEQGRDTVGGQWIVNQNNKSVGRIGLALALNPGQTFTPGSRQLAKLRFIPATGVRQDASLTFGDAPVTREVTDSAAKSLPASYSPGEIRTSTSLLGVSGNQLSSDIPRLGYRLNIETLVGKNYRVEWSDNMIDWQTLTTINSISANFDFLDQSATNSTRRFYRLVEQ